MDHPHIALCIGCGCDDANACYDPAKDAACHWERVDRAAGVGVCSCCPHLVAAFDAGDREIRGAADPDARMAEAA